MKLNSIENTSLSVFDGLNQRATKKNIIGADTISINPTRIAVFGVGGGGVNAINHMVESGITGITLYAANTDVQTLETCLAENIIPLGYKTCRGLGVGGDPIRGAEAAREMNSDLERVISEYDMIFLASGFGGGTGTGATPVIAEIAKSLNVLTVGILTMPFSHEGRERMQNAEQGLGDIEEIVDALLVIPNDNILSNAVIAPDLNMDDSFALINKILSQSVAAVTDIITIPSKVNIDFADIKSCLQNAGRVSIGMGFSDAQADSGGSAQRAADMALKNKLIDKENSAILQSAKKIVINAVIGKSAPLAEVNAIPNLVRDRVKGDPPTIKLGYRVNPEWDHQVEVTIIASSPHGVSTSQEFFPRINEKKETIQPHHEFNNKSKDDITGGYIDSDISAILNNKIDDDDELLSHIIDSEELENPALERLVGHSQSSVDTLAFSSGKE